jgi:hypothetical protein
VDVDGAAAEAMKIVRPEDRPRYASDAVAPDQFKAACREEIVGAIRRIAVKVADAEIARKRGGPKEKRRQKVQMVRAVSSAADLLCDYGGWSEGELPPYPTTTRAEDGGRFTELCVVLYAAATGRDLLTPGVLEKVRWELRQTIREYVNEEWAFLREGRGRGRRLEMPKEDPNWVRSRVVGPLWFWILDW